MDIQITSKESYVNISLDGREAYYVLGQMQPYTPDAAGDLVFLYDSTGKLQVDRIEIDLAEDTININGDTVFANAGDLMTALARAVFIGGALFSPSALSAVNASNTPLIDGAEYVGTGELNAFQSVMTVVNTDQNGVLYVELSQDGINWDTSLSFIYNTDRINPPHVFEKGVRFFRVRFLNNSGFDQTHFRLQCYFSSFNKLTAPINGMLAENYDATVVRPTDYRHEVAVGKRQGRNTENIFAFNTDIDTGVTEIIASFGGTFDPLVNIMNTDQTFTINYNLLTDGALTAGATSLLIYYFELADPGQIKQAVHVLGATGVDITSFSGAGINRAIVLSNGGAGFNVDDIDILATIDATIQAQVPANESVTQQALIHTPQNHTLLIDWFWLNAAKNAGGSLPIVKITGYSWSRVTQTRYTIFRAILDTQTGNPVPVNLSQPFPIGGREVVFFVASTNALNTEVDFRFSSILERES